MRKTEAHEGVQKIELKLGLKQTNKLSVKPALAPSRWFGYLSNKSLVQESKLNALEKWAFDVEAEARTGKWEIWVCFPFGYTTKEREYFKMPPSSVSLDSFRLLANKHGGYRPSSLFHWAVCIMFSLISALASRMTPPHWPEWRRIYLIYPYSYSRGCVCRCVCVWRRKTNLENYGSMFECMYVDICMYTPCMCIYVRILPTCREDVKMAGAFFRTKRSAL